MQCLQVFRVLFRCILEKLNSREEHIKDVIRKQLTLRNDLHMQLDELSQKGHVHKWLQKPSEQYSNTVPVT